MLDYDFKSALTEKQDVVKIEPEDVDTCILNAQNSEVYQSTSIEGQKAECSIIIGIYGNTT